MNKQPLNFITSACAIDNKAFINEITNSLVLQPISTGMNYEAIKVELRKKGYSLAMIATALNLSPISIQRVCKRLDVSHRTATAVATALDKEVVDVFPDVANYQGVTNFATPRQERIDQLKQRLAS